MNAHGYLVERAEHEQAERERFKAVLAPTDCCTYGCDQKGHGCPARSYPMATGCSTKAPPRPAAEPQQTEFMPVSGVEVLAIGVIVLLSCVAVGAVIWQAARLIFN